jgi:hypothetical protein
VTETKPPSVALADTTADLMRALAGWLLVAFGVLMVLTTALKIAGGVPDSTNPLLPALWGLLGTAIAASGAFLTPLFRRRIDRHTSLSDFGTVESVEQRVVRPEEKSGESCVVCGEAVTRGMARRFREEVVLAGLPLFTRSEGNNYYCPECGARELSVSGSGAETNTAVVEPGDGEKSAGSDPEHERDGPDDVERDSA